MGRLEFLEKTFEFFLGRGVPPLLAPEGDLTLWEQSRGFLRAMNKLLMHLENILFIHDAIGI